MRLILIWSLVAVCVRGAFAAPFERELDLPRDYTSRRVSVLRVVQPGETVTLMDTGGPGAIRHIWMTMGNNAPREIVLRMYWDDETEPSVEAPIADFFGVGHGRREPEEYFATPCLSVAPHNGYNVYLPMPFANRARVTITNEQDTPIVDGGGVYFQADYVRYGSLDPATPYFHAQWRREAPAARRGKPYTALQAIGTGFIAGITHHVRVDDTADEWYHGGGDTMYLDSGGACSVIKGIGGEDFVGESWHSSVFSSPYAGCTSHRNGRISMYRFFLEGPPRFNESAWFTLGAMENEMTSVAYWYQTEPHTRFAELAGREQRDPESTIVSGAFDRELNAAAQLPVAVLGPFVGDIDVIIPLDTQERIDVNRALSTNYGMPYADTIPDENNRTVVWQQSRTVLGWLDFDAIYKPKMAGPRGVLTLPWTVAYALIRVTCDTPMTRTLRIGHDDAVRVIVNGTVAANLAPQSEFLPREVELELARGTNDVLIKVSNTFNTNWAAFAVALGFDEPDGMTFESFESLRPVP